MKKLLELIKPLLLIIFGALMFLIYLDQIDPQADAKYLMIGIFGTVFAVYYITIGVINVTIGNRLEKNAKNVFDMLNVGLFAFLFLYETIVNITDYVDGMSGSGWIINIGSILAALCLIVFTILSKTSNKEALDRVALLFAALFATAMLLRIIFTPVGGSMPLLGMTLTSVALYTMFVFVLFGALKPANLEE